MSGFRIPDTHRKHSLTEFGLSKDTLKERCERAAYFEDLDNNPGRAEERALLYRRGDSYSLDEVEALISLVVTPHIECVLDNPDDFSTIERWHAERALEQQERAGRVLARMRGAAPVEDQPTFTKVEEGVLLTPKQERVICRLKELVFKADGRDAPDSYEFKQFELLASSTSGTVFVVSEVGRKGDEDTMASVFCRTRRMYAVRPTGHIRSLNRGSRPIKLWAVEYDAPMK